MGFTLLIVLVYLIPPMVAFWSSRQVTVNGTDQYYHHLLIETIKDNKHRFISDMPNFIGKNILGYPQLMHWILSFADKKYLFEYSRYFSIIFHFLSSLTLLSVTYLGYVYIGRIGDPIEIKELLLWTGIIYALAPFHYDMINAKNVGISARGLGVLLGQIYLYLLMLFTFSNSINYLLVAIPIVLLIYMSSAFTTQFVLLSAIPYLVLTQSIWILLPMIAAFIIYYILFPKVCRNYFQGQFNHKKLYYQHLADKYILKVRYSIWRDWVFDFWQILFVDKEKSLVDKIKYISTNSVVVAIISMPSLLVVFYLWQNNAQYLFKSNPFWLISIPIVTCLILFLGTSLRQTRFLGEPERYLEFSLGVAAMIIATYYQDNQWMIHLILVASVLFIVFRLWVYKKVLSKDTGLNNRNDAEQIKVHILQELEKSDGMETSVFCNSTQSSKVLFSRSYKTFWHTLFYPTVEQFHFTDLFKTDYSYISEEMILPILETIKIDFFVADKSTINQVSVYQKSDKIELNLLKSIGNFDLYSVSTIASNPKAVLN